MRCILFSFIGFLCILYDLIKKWNSNRQFISKKRTRYIIKQISTEWKNSPSILGVMIFLAGIVKIAASYLLILSGIYLILWDLRKLLSEMFKESKEPTGKLSFFQSVGLIILIILDIWVRVSLGRLLIIGIILLIIGTSFLNNWVVIN